MEPLREISGEEQAYALFSVVLAVLFWSTLILLIATSRRSNHWLKRFGLMMLVGNAALMWSTTAILRVTANMMPLLINMWSRMTYAMLAFYVLGYAWLQWRRPRGQS